MAQFCPKCLELIVYFGFPQSLITCRMDNHRQHKLKEYCRNPDCRHEIKNGRHYRNDGFIYCSKKCFKRSTEKTVPSYEL